VVRSFPCPVRFHSLGGQPVRSRDGCCLSGARPRGRACEARGSRLIEPRGAGGAAAQSCVAGFLCDPHPLQSPSDQLSRGWRIPERERNLGCFVYSSIPDLLNGMLSRFQGSGEFGREEERVLQEEYRPYAIY